MIKEKLVKFIIKNQKLTGTDNVYLAKHGSYLMAGNIISILASIILSIAFSRLLPKETYGQYRYILSVMTILAIFSLQGIDAAIIQGVAKGYEGDLKRGFQTKLKWGLLGSLASMCIAVYFWFQGNESLTFSFLILAVFLPLFKSGDLYRSYLDGKKLFNKRVNYTSFIQVIATAAIILTLLFTKNLIILIFVYFFSYTVLRTFFFFWIIAKIKLNDTADPATITYGKHLSLMSVLAVIAQQIDSILLFFFLGPIQLAIYSFSILPIEHIRIPLQNLQELALPKLVTRQEEELKNALPLKLLKASILITLAIIIYIILVPYLYQILYPNYLESILYSRWLSLTLLSFPASMIMLALQAKMKTKSLYKINGIILSTQIILLVFLVPFLGIWGIIIARLSTQFLYFILAYHFFKKIDSSST